MSLMTRSKLLRLLDSDRVQRAIEEAERQTSGEIRVSIAPFFWGNARLVAEKAFKRLGMTNTKERNGILFFVVPMRKQLVLLGDVGIHEKVGQDFWEHVVAAVTSHFKTGQFTEGLISGIEEVGKRLAEHFPYDHKSDVNELSNAIDIGKDNPR